MALYDRVADLPLRIDGFDLERREMDTSGGFTRVTTVVVLRGAGETGRGEDVTYDAPDHDAVQTARDEGTLEWDLAGEYTFDSFSARLDGVDLFPEPPERKTARPYRRWAVESAALDLALRQADTCFAAALDRKYEPLRFVVSTRLDGDIVRTRSGEPTADRVREWLDVDPELEFKLDPTTAWTQALMDDLAATGRVRILDCKGFYEGTEVDAEPDPELYRRIVESFPDAVIEDARHTAETREVLAGVEDRLSWDYPITDVESVRNLPVAPRWLNVKPSRFGTVESLLETIEYCLEREIGMYGGGQYELGVGREHLHALASAFYPRAPNDVAPREYNASEPRAGLPKSPLDPPADPRGLGWRRE